MNIFKVIGIAIFGIIILSILRQHKSEYTILVSIALGLVVLFAILEPLNKVVSEVSEFSLRISGGSTYFTTSVKVIGIAYLSGFATDICKDAGESALANKIEIAGKVIMMSVALPLMFGLVDMLMNILA